MFNVRTYGAVGTGAANDSSFIQKALDAAEAAGGGIVRVPDGIYRVHPAGPDRQLHHA